ncbi:MAG: hypothetical protein ACXQTP_03895 [Candidatus Methanofastidiosia archaeon]
MYEEPIEGEDFFLPKNNTQAINFGLVAMGLLKSACKICPDKDFLQKAEISIRLFRQIVTEIRNEEIDFG